jgi:hypothetical protein
VRIVGVPLSPGQLLHCWLQLTPDLRNKELDSRASWGTVRKKGGHCPKELGLGERVVQEPTDQPYGVRDCAMRDPAGNLLRIQELH